MKKQQTTEPADAPSPTAQHTLEQRQLQMTSLEEVRAWLMRLRDNALKIPNEALAGRCEDAIALIAAPSPRPGLAASIELAELNDLLHDVRPFVAASAAASHFIDGFGEIGLDGLPQGAAKHTTADDELLQRLDATIAAVAAPTNTAPAGAQSPTAGTDHQCAVSSGQSTEYAASKTADTHKPSIWSA